MHSLFTLLILLGFSNPSYASDPSDDPEIKTEIKRLTGLIDNDPKYSEADRQNVKEMMKDATKGNFTKVKAKDEEIKKQIKDLNIQIPTPQETDDPPPDKKVSKIKPKPAVETTGDQAPAQPAETVIIDGTSIPKEIEFPGKPVKK